MNIAARRRQRRKRARRRDRVENGHKEVDESQVRRRGGSLEGRGEREGDRKKA